MSDVAELVELLDGASRRFEAVRMTVRSWIDRDQFRRGLVSFASNSRVAAWLDRIRREEEPSGAEVEVWRVWFQHPNFAREERYGGDPPAALVEAAGRHGDQEWQYLPEEGRPIVHAASPSTVAFGIDDQGRPYSSYDVPPGFGAMFHPVVVELLDPSEMLKGGLSLEPLGRTQYLGREAIQARGWFRNWDERDPFFFENFPPASEYGLTVDAQVGIILRVACRTDDAEFALRKVKKVIFNEPLPMEVFLPPGSGTRP